MRIEIIIDHEERSFIIEACEVKDNYPNDGYFQITEFNGSRKNYPKSSFHYRNLDTTAHWEKHPNDREWDVCSNCHIGVKRREYGWLKDDPWVSEFSYQYCPWCGAKMKGE